MWPLKRRPLPNSLVTIDDRGRRKEAVHIGGESCARVPTARARRFSRATRAAVAESSGRVNELSTASVVATGGGSLGSVIRARTVSILPDARVRMTLATRLPSASTGTGPSACHAPFGDAMKWRGSPASAPRIETIESAGEEGALSVRRTIAPGSGLAGAMERREL
jgi:cyanophycinase-like exopeptidase